jgi:hypothetical protein
MAPLNHHLVHAIKSSQTLENAYIKSARIHPSSYLVNRNDLLFSKGALAPLFCLPFLMSINYKMEF